MIRPQALARWAVPLLFVLLAASTGAHAAHSVSHALTETTTRAWLVATYGLLRTGVALAFALFTIGRAAPRRPARSPLAFVACAVAIAAVIALADPSRGTPEGVVLAGELIAVSACVWLLVSVVFLGRCFGVLPEARGLVTRGPYHLVRHPVYLGEIAACAGLAIAAPAPLNWAALAFLILAQSVRMGLEERALSEAFPSYADYAARTPRLLPRLAARRSPRVRNDEQIVVEGPLRPESSPTTARAPIPHA